MQFRSNKAMNNLHSIIREHEDNTETITAQTSELKDNVLKVLLKIEFPPKFLVRCSFTVKVME